MIGRLIFALCLVMAPAVSAAPVSFAFTTGAGTAGIIGTGYDLSPLSGVFTYDPAITTDSLPGDDQSLYANALTAFAFRSRAGGVTGGLSGPVGGEIEYTRTLAVEAVRIRLDATDAVVSETATGYSFGRFVLGVATADRIFSEINGGFILNRAIDPARNPNTISASILLEFPDETDPFKRLQVSYDLLTLARVTPVPLPASAALLVLGVAALGALGRRRAARGLSV